MQEIHELLQRGRELSVQAKNDTNTDDDRDAIQKELHQLIKEVDRISTSTEFNTQSLLNVTSVSDKHEQEKAIEALQKYWLKNSEALVKTYYGLEADGASLRIEFVENSNSSVVAWVSGSYYGSGTDGRYFNQKLVLDMSDFSPISMPDGGGSWISNDRIIAHEMTHAIMGRTTNMRDLPKWFTEGAAEFIAGADERLAIDSANGTAFNALKNEIDTWDGTSADYSAGYAAVKFLDNKLSGGIKSLFDAIKVDGGNQTLDDALITLVGPGYDTAAFIADFKANATFANSNIVLGDADTGAIGGGDDSSTVPNTLNTDLLNPLSGFVEAWPTDEAALPLRIGPGINVELVNVTATSLGIDNIDVKNQDQDAVAIFDGAIQKVSSERSRLGSYQNRLEKAINVSAVTEENLTSAESRIRDVDMAKEMMLQTKQSILAQAAQAMLIQSNQQPQQVIQLLR